MLLLRHEQNMEYEAFPPEQHNSGGPVPGSPRISMRAGRVRSPGRDDDDDDEAQAYFESLDDDDDDDDDAASGPGIASPSALAADTMPSSESPPSAQDVDAASAGEAVSDVPEAASDAVISGAIGTVEDSSAAGAGATQGAGESPAEESMSASVAASIAAAVAAPVTEATGSPPRSPPADAEEPAAAVANEVDVPNHAPKRQKISGSATGAAS